MEPAEENRSRRVRAVHAANYIHEYRSKVCCGRNILNIVSYIMIISVTCHGHSMYT
jgi:hypothetical protein